MIYLKVTLLICFLILQEFKMYLFPLHCHHNCGLDTTVVEKSKLSKIATNAVERQEENFKKKNLARGVLIFIIIKENTPEGQSATRCSSISFCSFYLKCSDSEG